MNKKSVKSVLKEYAQSNIPDSSHIDLWPAIQARIARGETSHYHQLVSHSSWRSRLPARNGSRPRAFAGMIALTFLVVGLATLLTLSSITKPTAVSASEILARVDNASRLGNAINGIHSSHELLTIRFRTNSADQFTEGNGEWWNQAPDKSRSETTLRTPTGEDYHYFIGTNDGTVYMYLPTENEFRLYSASQRTGSIEPDLETATQQASRIADLDAYDASIVGTESVKGRLAYVLDFTVKPNIQDAPNNFNPAAYRKKMWIDQQFYMVLGEQDWNRDGSLLYELQLQSLEVEPNLDASIFEFDPPTGTIVADMRPTNASEIAAGWQDVVRKFGGDLFRATTYPEWMTPGRPYYDVSRGIVSQAFTTQTGKTGDVLSLVVSEGLSSTPSLNVQGWGEGSPTDIGGLAGRLYSKAGAYILDVDRNGTRISIYAPANADRTRNRLVSIVESMVAVTSK